MQTLMRNLVFFTGVMVAALWGSTAYATVIWDRSPAMTGGTVNPVNWVNRASSQNFADSVRFSTGAIVSGVDIYSAKSNVSIGQLATVRLWSDAGGTPGVLLNSVVTTISAINMEGGIPGVSLKHADITPFLLDADTTYWIGMSGGDMTTDSELGQAGLFFNDGKDEEWCAVFNGTSYKSVVNRDMAFRLEGTVGSAPVPEPGTFILLGIGFSGLALCRKKRHC